MFLWDEDDESFKEDRRKKGVKQLKKCHKDSLIIKHNYIGVLFFFFFPAVLLLIVHFRHFLRGNVEIGDLEKWLISNKGRSEIKNKKIFISASYWDILIALTQYLLHS